MENADLDFDNKDDRQKTLKAVLHYFYQDNSRSGAHCRYNLKYHLVWSPKYRRKLLVGRFADRTKEILFDISTEYQFKIIAVEVMPDHIHLLLESPAIRDEPINSIMLGLMG